MTNEMPLSLFSILAVADFVLVFYTILKISKLPSTEMILIAAISSSLSFILANSILNGNVVVIQSTGTEYSYIPIQSLPIHYLLLMFGVMMAIVSVFFVVYYIHNYTQSAEKSALGDWAGEKYG